MKKFFKSFAWGIWIGFLFCWAIAFYVAPLMLVVKEQISPWWMLPWVMIVCGSMGVMLSKINEGSRELPPVSKLDLGGYTPKRKLDTSNPPKGGSGMVYPRVKPTKDDEPVGYPGDILNHEKTWISPIYKKPDGLSYRFENGVEKCLGYL